MSSVDGREEGIEIIFVKYAVAIDGDAVQIGFEGAALGVGCCNRFNLECLVAGSVSEWVECVAGVVAVGNANANAIVSGAYQGSHV